MAGAGAPVSAAAPTRGALIMWFTSWRTFHDAHGVGAPSWCGVTRDRMLRVLAKARARDSVAIGVLFCDRRMLQRAGRVEPSAVDANELEERFGGQSEARRERRWRPRLQPLLWGVVSLVWRELRRPHDPPPSMAVARGSVARDSLPPRR